MVNQDEVAKAMDALRRSGESGYAMDGGWAKVLVAEIDRLRSEVDKTEAALGDYRLRLAGHRIALDKLENTSGIDRRRAAELWAEVIRLRALIARVHHVGLLQRDRNRRAIPWHAPDVFSGHDEASCAANGGACLFLGES